MASKASVSRIARAGCRSFGGRKIMVLELQVRTKSATSGCG